MPISLAASLLLALTSVSSAGSITVNDVAPHARELSSAKYEGRLTLAPGGTLASNYIENQFKTIGLRPGKEGSYFHEFPVTFQMKAGDQNLMEFRTNEGQIVKAKLDTDFRPLLYSQDGRTVEGEMVFVGFGLHDQAWDDYAQVDLRGKIAVALRGGPQTYRYVSNAEKALVAMEAGAVGLLVVGPDRPGASELPTYQRAQGISRVQPFVAAAVTSSLIRQVTGVDLNAERNMEHPSSRVLLGAARFKTHLVPNTGNAKNVVGYLPGKDPVLKDEYVIVGAHYDHIGHGEVGSISGSDAIHFGADDNASGTSTVIALAKYFATRADNRRTIIFQLYQGEELGLLGSEAWAKQNPEILKKTSAMLNLDMVGRLRNGEMWIYGTSTSPSWKALLGKIIEPGIKPILEARSRVDSDHAAFAMRNVPVLFFFTGLHNEYHTERDTFDTLNTEGMASVANFVAKTIEQIDALPSKAGFNAEAVVGNAANDRSGSARDSSRRIRIGFIPQMSGDAKGVALNGASPGSPAEKAGFKSGDIIIQFGETKIESLEDLQEAMMTAKPGVTVKVRFIRDGVEKVADVTPEGLA